MQGCPEVLSGSNAEIFKDNDETATASQLYELDIDAIVAILDLPYIMTIRPMPTTFKVEPRISSFAVRSHGKRKHHCLLFQSPKPLCALGLSGETSKGQSDVLVVRSRSGHLFESNPSVYPSLGVMPGTGRSRPI